MGFIVIFGFSVGETFLYVLSPLFFELGRGVVSMFTAKERITSCDQVPPRGTHEGALPPPVWER
jgi:hypothetical protein